MKPIPLCLSPGSALFRKKPFALAALFLMLMLPTSDLLAQRITYEYLRMRDRQPNVFFEHLIVPDTSSDNMQLVTAFRFENNFLTFRRLREEQRGDQIRRFYSEPSVQLTIRKLNGTSERDGSSDSAPVITRTWSETIYAETYEQTQSSTTFIQDMITAELEPGRYRIETQVQDNGRPRRGLPRVIRLPEQTDTDFALLYFLDNQNEISLPLSSPLMNMGRNVFFGRDHQIAIWFPAVQDDAEYSLEIHKLRISRQDTTVLERVFEQEIDQASLLTGYRQEIKPVDGIPHFQLNPADNSNSYGAFFLIHIPNSTFENAPYRVRLNKKPADGEPGTIAQRSYQSLWLDMPVSLLNLDVAINMMRFILDDEQHRSLRRGNRQQREKQFREFWSARDPSPEMEYNELMVEFFRRIDYAFENFTTPQKPGYESDQGMVYIRHGEPDRRERTFPPNQPAREIWYYDTRSFVFEATTGFGDYRLVERR